MDTTNEAVPRARAKRGVDPRRVQMSLTPDERKDLDKLAADLGISDSATAAMIYRKGLAAMKAGQQAVHTNA